MHASPYPRGAASSNASTCATAIREVHRALRPGGTFLIANLQSFDTAYVAGGWTIEADGTRRLCIDHYPEERPVWSAWRVIRIRNWYRR